MENENKNFISKKVNPILEKMVVEILIKKPDNCVKKKTIKLIKYLKILLKIKIY